MINRLENNVDNKEKKPDDDGSFLVMENLVLMIA